MPESKEKNIKEWRKDPDKGAIFVRALLRGAPLWGAYRTCVNGLQNILLELLGELNPIKDILVSLKIILNRAVVEAINA